MSIKRIAILLCNVDKPELEPQYPNDGVKYQRFFQPLFPEATFDVFRIVDQQYPPDDLDHYQLFFITGSVHSAYEDLPWIAPLQQLILRLHTCKKKLVGFCFGHQIIAQTLGGSVEKSPRGWGLGLKTVAFDHRPWMVPHRSKLNIIHIHQDQVVRLPEGADPIAGSKFCPYEAFVIDRHILACQGHPEFSNTYTQDLCHCVRQRFPDDVYQSALSSLTQENDGHVFAQWVRSFVDM